MRERFPCVCCGHLTMGEPPGSYEICPVCFWEDDLIQLRWATTVRGANRLPLAEAQQNYRAYGACDEHGRQFVRAPLPDEPVEPAWRPIEPDHDSFEDLASEERVPWPDPYTTLYWWTDDFWRAAQSTAKRSSK
ncbi:hypothetical protein GCM10009789_78570 [Kribbella sancticallisti]|uniref:Cysteine-rich CPCC domain-containing protein n=1 Tax=Kribbella sancticallisti TaxID=460087 RepID=A0ABP4QIE6_9ACTN